VPAMKLENTFTFNGYSYELRGIVDGRYVVRTRNRRKNTENYIVLTSDEWNKRHKKQRIRADTYERNAEIYERHLSGETYAVLGRDFDLSRTTISNICRRQERRERRKSVV